MKHLTLLLTLIALTLPSLSHAYPGVGFMDCELSNKYNDKKYVTLYTTGDFRRPNIEVITPLSVARPLVIQWNKKYIEQGRYANFVVIDAQERFTYSFQIDPNQNGPARFRDISNRQLGFETLEARFTFNGTCTYRPEFRGRNISGDILTSL